MHKLLMTAAALFLVANAGQAQTQKIQDEIAKKLDGMRKDQAALQDLLAAALKTNPDIRVAEAKVRDAEAELYRARMTVLNAIVTMRHDINSAKAVAEEAAARYERDLELKKRVQGSISDAELSASKAAMLKFKFDADSRQAQLDAIVGKNTAKAGEWQRLLEQGAAPRDPRPPLTQTSSKQSTPLAVSEDMAKKLDVLGAMVRVEFTDNFVDGTTVLDLLREHAKGINIQENFAKPDKVNVKLRLTEKVPLGALFEWAEDQCGWRFVIRDYGIVVTNRDAVPPAGGVMLLDYWRKNRTQPKTP